MDGAGNVSRGRRSGLESDLTVRRPYMIIQVPLPHQLLYITSEGCDRMLPSPPLSTQVITVCVYLGARLVCNTTHTHQRLFWELNVALRMPYRHRKSYMICCIFCCLQSLTGVSFAELWIRSTNHIKCLQFVLVPALVLDLLGGAGAALSLVPVT